LPFLYSPYSSGISNILARARRKQMKQIFKKKKEKGRERERERERE